MASLECTRGFTLGMDDVHAVPTLLSQVQKSNIGILRGSNPILFTIYMGSRANVNVLDNLRGKLSNSGSKIVSTDL